MAYDSKNNETDRVIDIISKSYSWLVIPRAIIVSWSLSCLRIPVLISIEITSVVSLSSGISVINIVEGSLSSVGMSASKKLCISHKAIVCCMPQMVTVIALYML